MRPGQLTRKPRKVADEAGTSSKLTIGSVDYLTWLHDLYLGNGVDFDKYPTSSAIATVDTTIPAKTVPSDDATSTAASFKLDLFNIGGNRNQNPYIPYFECSFGDYHFYKDRDREIAEKHGFSTVKDIFDYLNAFLKREPLFDAGKFTTPWHEIDLVFRPRKRKQSALEMQRALEKLQMTAAAPGEPESPPAAEQSADELDQQNDAKPICLDDTIQAVIRHPLLMCRDPVPIDHIITSAPHLLHGPSVLWILAHEEMRNEVVNQKLFEQGIVIPSNVIAHRKKAALEHMGGTYKDRKAQFEEFRRSMLAAYNT